MGVKFNVKKLLAFEDFAGQTKAQHTQLADQIRGKVVAIDSAQWLFQASTQPERDKAFGKNRTDHDAFVANSVTFFLDRCLQLLRYGAHPIVVMEGSAPRAKLDTLRARGSIVGDHASGMTAKYQNASDCISRLCQAMVRVWA